MAIIKVMLRLCWAFCIFLSIAAAAEAQDDLGAFGGLFGGDVGISAPPPRGAAPAAPARGAVPSAPDRLIRLKEALFKANTPLAREQETALNAILDAEVPAMRRSLQAKVAELGLRPVAPATPAPAAAPNPQQAPAGARGQRGAAPIIPNLDPQAEATIRRFILGLNDQLLKKVAAAPALRPEQQAVLTALYKDQIRGRGGLDAIQLALEDAGTPFTAEQISQIQPIFDEQDQARAQLLRESQGGQPDPSKVSQLEQATLLKVLRLLTAAQRTALQAASAKPQP